MRSVGFRGPIFSFEPVNAAFEVLEQRAKSDELWYVFNYALGASAGNAQINVLKFSQFSSILSATSYGNIWENMEVVKKQDTIIRTIDEYFREGLIGNAHRYLLKMDTQGYDLEVFRGAKSVLHNVSCILSELSWIPLYQEMPTYLESLAEYNGEGYLVSGLYPITRNINLALNEVDCVLVRPERLFADLPAGATAA